MNNLQKRILVKLKKGYEKTRLPLLKNKMHFEPFHLIEGEAVNALIRDYILNANPCMISRLGADEMKVVYRYSYIKQKKFSSARYVFGDEEPGWWTDDFKYRMPIQSGFFNPTVPNLERFAELMLKDMLMVDVLGSWQPKEWVFRQLLDNAIKVPLGALEPFGYNNPWTEALKHKKVLVVHPFADSIQQQYKKRTMLFANINMLPEFDLITVKAIQSHANSNPEFASWFDALEYLKRRIDEHDYDVALLGCGAYGFPLAAHCKRMGKVAIHLGGPLQLLFGIIGKRWENWPSYCNMFNAHWVRPANAETPQQASLLEEACYW